MKAGELLSYAQEKLGQTLTDKNIKWQSGLTEALDFTIYEGKITFSLPIKYGTRKDSDMFEAECPLYSVEEDLLKEIADDGVLAIACSIQESVNARYKIKSSKEVDYSIDEVTGG